MEVKDVTTRDTAVIRTTTTHKELGAKFGEILPAVYRSLQARGVAPDMPPFGYYLSFHPERVEFEAGFILASPVAADGMVVPSQLPAGRVVSHIHVGPYQELERTHTAIKNYIKEQAWRATGKSWEYYWDDPGNTPAEELKTEVLYLLES